MLGSDTLKHIDSILLVPGPNGGVCNDSGAFMILKYSPQTTINASSWRLKDQQAKE
jgi:hypothetical protein